jgi:hypothetical protein
MEKIIQEKTSADHLLYVSLKYTKTTDVILNLLERWKILVETCLDRALERAKKKKLIKSIPSAPKLKIDKSREVFKKNKEIIDALDLLEFFKRVPTKERLRENEFRKNVTLRILDRGQWIAIDIEKLKEYNEIIEKFIREIKQLI